MLSSEALIQSPYVVSTDADLHQLTVHRDTVSMARVLLRLHILRQVVVDQPHNRGSPLWLPTFLGQLHGGLLEWCKAAIVGGEYSGEAQLLSCLPTNG